jgi:hypothetical protein
MTKANDVKVKAARLAEEAERNLGERIRAAGDQAETVIPPSNEWLERNRVIKAMTEEIEKLRIGAEGGAVIVLAVHKDLSPAHLFHVEGGDATWYTLVGLMEQVSHMMKDHFIRSQQQRAQQEMQRQQQGGPTQ